MHDESSIPVGFDGVTRLFPLPNTVLFPYVTLPLHIFEPRYRQMTADALAGDRLTVEGDHDPIATELAAREVDGADCLEALSGICWRVVLFVDLHGDLRRAP